MERDEVILGAFCLFVLLLGIRQRLHRTGQGQDQTEDGSRFRLVFRIAGLVVLGGLIIYMVPVLWRDFRMFGQGRLIEFFLRCLIFVFTIYILGSGVRILLQRRNKENSGK